MLSTIAIVGGLAIAAAEKRNFVPQEPAGLEYHEERVWFHLSRKCFIDEAAVREFKDFVIEAFPCVTFDERRKEIFHHVMENNTVWSLWFEVDNSAQCLSQSMELPESMPGSCVENVLFEPLQFPEPLPSACGTQGTQEEIDLWSLDILDGFPDDIYIHPLWTDSELATDETVEAIILDEDVDTNHIEFSGLTATNLLGRKLSNQDHGTHVAGTVVGHTVGGSKHTNFAYYAVCQSAYGCSWSDIEGGYNAAIAYMKRDSSKRYVINYSVGGGRSDFTDAMYNDWGKQINAAGGIWVTSAGNSGDNACLYSPAFTTEAVTVGAYDNKDYAAWFSNYGSCVDVWGPGVAVYSAAVGGGYVAFSGTSMSSPNVASMVVNLLKQDSSLTLANIKANFIRNARNVDNGGVEGRMNQAFLSCSGPVAQNEF